MTANTDRIRQRNEIESPCVRLCALHPAARICVGCYRTPEEIGSWSRLSPAARRAIIADLPGRAPRLQKRRGDHAGRPRTD